MHKSLLLWEKVAGALRVANVLLTDEESKKHTPHPPLMRSPFPHWGRLYMRALTIRFLVLYFINSLGAVALR